MHKFHNQRSGARRGSCIRIPVKKGPPIPCWGGHGPDHGLVVVTRLRQRQRALQTKGEPSWCPGHSAWPISRRHALLDARQLADKVIWLLPTLRLSPPGRGQYKDLLRAVNSAVSRSCLQVYSQCAKYHDDAVRLFIIMSSHAQRADTQWALARTRNAQRWAMDAARVGSELMARRTTRGHLRSRCVCALDWSSATCPRWARGSSTSSPANNEHIRIISARTSEGFSPVSCSSCEATELTLSGTSSSARHPPLRACSICSSCSGHCSGAAASLLAWKSVLGQSWRAERWPVFWIPARVLPGHAAMAALHHHVSSRLFFWRSSCEVWCCTLSTSQSIWSTNGPFLWSQLRRTAQWQVRRAWPRGATPSRKSPRLRNGAWPSH